MSTQNNIDRTKVELEDKMAEMDKKLSKLEDEIEKFKGAMDSKYRDVQTGVKLTWEDLNMSYENNKTQFSNNL